MRGPIAGLHYTQASGFKRIQIAEKATEDDFDEDYVDAVLKAEGATDQCWDFEYVGPDSIHTMYVTMYRSNSEHCKWDAVFVVSLGFRIDFIVTDNPADTMSFFFDRVGTLLRMPVRVWPA